jgi:hypothetical protein
MTTHRATPLSVEGVAENVLSVFRGARPEFSAYATLKIAPVPAGLSADPRTVATWTLRRDPRSVCQTTGNAIRAGGMHNSGGLRIATNFAVNVIHYGHGVARASGIWDGRWMGRVMKRRERLARIRAAGGVTEWGVSPSLRHAALLSGRGGLTLYGALSTLAESRAYPRGARWPLCHCSRRL